MHTGPIRFPDWKNVLARSTLSPQLKAAFVREILAFLKHCKTHRAPATTELARQYLTWREKQSAGPAREALRWFYKEGWRRTDLSAGDSRDTGPTGVARTASAPTDPASRQSWHSMPPPAASDLGSTPWEQALIKVSRERGFLWRTEQTYREWAVRFARFIAPRSPHAATGVDVAAFLSALAVLQRASPSTQKQALRVNGFANAVG
jgi:uncharacterized protein YhaN